MLTFSVAPVVRRRPTNWNHGRNARPAPKHPRSNNSFQRTGLRPAADAGLRRHAAMAIDGPGIVESDLGHDVYNEILDLYDAGLEPTAILERLSSYETELIGELEKEIYLAASAKAFWEIGHLDKALSSRLTDLVSSGKSLAAWASTSDSTLASQREAALGRLLRQLAGPKKSPRPRKKYAQVKTKLLVMEPRTASTVESFIAGRYFGRRIPSAKGGSVFGPHVIRPEHRMIVRSGNPFAMVGHVELDPDKFMLGSFGGVLEMEHVIKDFVRTESNAPQFGRELLPLRDLLKH